MNRFNQLSPPTLLPDGAVTEGASAMAEFSEVFPLPGSVGFATFAEVVAIASSEEAFPTLGFFFDGIGSVLLTKLAIAYVVSRSVIGDSQISGAMAETESGASAEALVSVATGSCIRGDADIAEDGDPERFACRAGETHPGGFLVERRLFPIRGGWPEKRAGSGFRRRERRRR